MREDSNNAGNTNTVDLNGLLDEKEARSRENAHLLNPGARVVGVARSVDGMTSRPNVDNTTSNGNSNGELCVDYGYGYAECYRYEDSRAGCPSHFRFPRHHRLYRSRVVITRR